MYYHVALISQFARSTKRARPHAVALASYTEDGKITKNTVGFTRKDIWNDFTNLTKYYASDYFKVNRSVMNLNCYLLCIAVWNRSIHIFKVIWNMLKCNFVFRGMCLSTFSHDAVPILASAESIADGAPNCKTGKYVYGECHRHSPCVVEWSLPVLTRAVLGFRGLWVARLMACGCWV